MARKPTPKAPPFVQEDINGYSMYKLRKILKLSQTEFWNPARVTQFSGSRYETHVREIPDDTRVALSFVWHSAIKANAEQIGVRL